jgi:hypothetical protein
MSSLFLHGAQVEICLRVLDLQGKADLYEFGGNDLDFLLTLTPYNVGDADLYCLPATENVPPDPLHSSWASGVDHNENNLALAQPLRYQNLQDRSTSYQAVYSGIISAPSMFLLLWKLQWLAFTYFPACCIFCHWFEV